MDADNDPTKQNLRTICVDDHDNVYAAGSRWAARLTQGRFTPLTDQTGRVIEPPGVVHALCTTPDGSLWLGTENDGLYRWNAGHYEQVGLDDKFITALLSAGENGLWIGTLGQGLARWQNGVMTNYALEARNITALAEDKSGRLWLGTAGGTIFAFHQGVFTRYDPQKGIYPSTIYCLWPNPDGSLWIGTGGSGLLIFEHGKFFQITTANGAHSDYIYTLHPDDYGQIWLGSEQGLFRIPRAQIEAFKRGQRDDVESFFYGRSEGLSSMVFCQNSYMPRQTSDGRLWLAAHNGVVSFDPRLLQASASVPQVYLDSVLVNGQGVQQASPDARLAIMELPALIEKIEFSFSAPILSAPERVKLRYQLEGWDTAWQEGSKTHRASYGRLPPGDYRFHVTVRDHEGNWNRTGASWVFTVLPVFWQTSWFRVSTLLIAAALLIMTVRFFSHRRLWAALKHEQTLARERSRIAADLHDDVGAHLTRIAQLGELAREDPLPSSANPRLEQIAQAARHTVEIMDEIVWTMNPRNDSLPHLIGYLGDYAAEFISASDIQLHADLPENPPPVKLASEVRHHLLLAVKELLNNAVKHSGATTVFLRVTSDKHMLCITVRDDGRGFVPDAPNTGAGLDNLRQRLQSCHGTVQVSSTPGQGTTITLSLPLEENTHG